MPFRLRSYSGVSCEAVQPITALTPLLRHLVQNLAAQSTPPAALPSNQQPASSTARNNSDLTAASSGRSLPLPSQSTAESSSGRNALPLNLPVLGPIQSRTSAAAPSAPSDRSLPAAPAAPAKLPAARIEIAAQPVEVEEDDDETPDESNWPPPRIVPAVVPASSISGGVVAVGSATVGLQAASRVVPSSPKRPLPIPAQTGPSTPSRKKTTKRRRLLLEEDDEDATVV